MKQPYRHWIGAVVVSALTVVLSARALAAAPPPVTAGPPPVLAVGPSPVFQDVPSDFWAVAAIDRLAGQGVIQGTGHGLFAPNSSLTRSQFAALLARLYQVPTGTVGPAFTDVPSSEWFATDVEDAAGLGWMEGVAPGLFDPSAPITRAEAAVVLARVLGLGQVATDENDLPVPYADAAQIPSYARGAVLVALHLGLMTGFGTAFLPNDPVTRAQAALILDRLEGVTRAQLAAEGDRVARGVEVDASTPAPATGTSVTLHAYANDATGYVLPASFSWSVDGGTLTADGATATWTSPSPGTFTVTATIAGGKVAGSVSLHVDQAVSIEDNLAPAVLAGTPWPIQVSLLDAQGTVVTGAHLSGQWTLTGPCAAQGPCPEQSGSATVLGGEASLTLPALIAGQYQWVLALPGVPAMTQSLQVVSAPLGQLVLQGNTQPVAGSTNTVQIRIATSTSLPTGVWPVDLSTSGQSISLPLLPSEAPAGPPLSLSAESILLPAAGSSVSVSADAVGSGTVVASVPGGALSTATFALTIKPAASFAQAYASPTVAGTMAHVHIDITGIASSVDLEPIDPAGHLLSPIAATVQDGVATASFVPTQAGTWSLRWSGKGLVPVQSGTLTVTPGTATQLVIDPTPTSVLLPGQTATVKAWIADRYGNAIAQPFSLHAQVSGSAGTLRLSAGTLNGIAVAGLYTATTPGATVVVFSSPNHPNFPPVRLTLRTVATSADRVAGKGLWLTYPVWSTTPDTTLLQTASQDGVTHIYLEVATSLNGFYGGIALDNFLRKAHDGGITVVAWVYAALSDPSADDAILREVAQYQTPTGDRPDGVALDIEQVLTPSVVQAYAALAAQLEGPSGLVVGVTDPPQFDATYPYASLAGSVQVFAPMDYWAVRETGNYCYDDVYRFVQRSIDVIRQESGEPNVPVDVIAEAFDWFSPTGTGIFSPSPLALSAAIQAAAAGGAIGVSFYRYSTWTAAEAQVMADPWSG